MIQVLETYKRSPLSLFLRIAVTFAMLVTLVTMLFLVGYVLVQGIPYVKPSLFSFHYTSENVSFLPSIFTTIVIVFGAIVIAGPLGIFAAVYLVEYAHRGNKIVSLVRLTAETLSGIPSIVFGLFGMLFFVTTLHFGYSIVSGILTISIMILPLIMRTTEEALKSVPDSYREGSYGLGAGKLRTVRSVVLPAAIPGILAGIILAIGRVVGETAALIYTAGTVADFPKGIFSSGRTLAVHMFELSHEGLHFGEAYATAVILMVLVLIINWISNVIASRIEKL